jgi:hypothetical protein
MGEELERIWKEAVVDYIKVASAHQLGGTENNHRERHVAWSMPLQKFKPEFPPTKSKVLPSEPIGLVKEKW